MEKISEAGKLYLKDIYILEEARKDTHDFLNYIADQVFEKWEAYKDEQKLFNESDQITWSAWKAKGNPGQLDLYPKLTGIIDNQYFEEGDSGLCLYYRDARHTKKLNDTIGVRIHMSYTNAFWKKIKQLPPDKLAQALAEAKSADLDMDLEDKVPFSMQIQINLEDTATTIEEITEIIIEKCKGLEVFLLKCL